MATLEDRANEIVVKVKKGEEYLASAGILLRALKADIEAQDIKWNPWADAHGLFTKRHRNRLLAGASKKPPKTGHEVPIEGEFPKTDEDPYQDLIEDTKDREARWEQSLINLADHCEEVFELWDQTIPGWTTFKVTTKALKALNTILATLGELS